MMPNAKSSLSTNCIRRTGGPMEAAPASSASSPCGGHPTRHTGPGLDPAEELGQAALKSEIRSR